MKKSIIAFIVLFITTLSINADDFKIRLIENETGYMEVQMKCVNAGITPTTSTPISGFTFQIRWLISLGADVDILCASNPYNLIDGLGTIQTEGSYNWRTYAASGTPFNCPTTWVFDEWETITSFIVTTGSGTGDFEIAPDLWVAQGLNWQIEDPVVFYNPDVISGISSYPFPTTIYNYVWTGAAGGPPSQNNGYKWEKTANWEGQCPGDAPPEGSFPYLGQTDSYLLIPAGLSKYPELTTGSDDWGWAANIMFIQSGAHVTVPDLETSTSNPELFIDGDLVIGGTLNLSPKGHTTVTGSTTINSAEGIIVQADATGVGSYIDNGTITYGAGGTAKVQTFLANTAAVDKFHPHLIGPTVDMDNYTGPGTGVLLSAFNVAPGLTYAYEWDEPTGDWVNLVANAEEIPTTKGIYLSTTNATSETLEMTGELITGMVSSEPMSNTNLGDFLLSNPYPSSIFWNDMYTDNGGNVSDAMSVWDGIPAAGGGTGNYKSYNTGSGGTGGFTGYIQVGQGFFVISTGINSFEFFNDQRDHSVDPFYAPLTEFSNRLDVRLTGATFGDGLLLHFYDDATSEFEPNEDIKKIDSRYDEAPEIWTDLEDGSNLSINAMPVELLGNNMFTVPMSFKCGYEGTYNLSFLDIESFETGTEIWLEDLKTGNDWVSLNHSPEYTFEASPGDLTDRFLIHFFGPTGTYEFSNLNTVNIYSYGNYAYVVNNTDERIKHVLIYNLAGELIMNEKVPEQKINKLRVSDKLGYFIVKVITDENIYLEKVMISYY